MYPRNFDEFSTHIVNQVKINNLIHSINVNIDKQTMLFILTDLKRVETLVLLDTYLQNQHFEYTYKTYKNSEGHEMANLYIYPHIRFRLTGDKPIQ